MNPYDPPMSNVNPRDEVDETPELNVYQCFLYGSILTALKITGVLGLGLLWYVAGIRVFWATTIGVPLALVIIIAIWLKWPDGYTKRRHAYLREKRRQARDAATPRIVIADICRWFE